VLRDDLRLHPRGTSPPSPSRAAPAAPPHPLALALAVGSRGSMPSVRDSLLVVRGDGLPAPRAKAVGFAARAGRVRSWRGPADDH